MGISFIKALSSVRGDFIQALKLRIRHPHQAALEGKGQGPEAQELIDTKRSSLPHQQEKTGAESVPHPAGGAKQWAAQGRALEIDNGKEQAKEAWPG